MSSKIITISHELLMIRYNGGIKFIPPKKPSDISPTQTVTSLLNSPFSFYLLDNDGYTNNINEEGANVCGFDSVNQSIGKSILDVGIKAAAEPLIKNCHEVISINSVKIFEETHIRKDGKIYQFLSIKCPWYGEKDKILGVCGFSIALGKHALAESLAKITQLGLLNYPTPLQQSIFDPKKELMQKLTKREIDCLHYAVKGFTAKRIAKALNISFRTVEEYLLNIRCKLGVSSKAQLIELVLDYL